MKQNAQEIFQLYFSNNIPEEVLHMNIKFLNYKLLTNKSFSYQLTQLLFLSIIYIQTRFIQMEDNQQKVFYLGQNLDVLDTVKKWMNAQVIKISSTQIFIHYTGWSYKYDQWINKKSDRILIQWEPGLNININNRVDVFQEQMGWLQARVIDKKQNQIKIHFYNYQTKYDHWVRLNDNNKLAQIGKHSKAYGVGKKKYKQSQKNTQLMLERFRKEIDAFKKNSKNQNFVIKQIEGDGNCLFRSISDQLYGDQKYYKQIRQLCVNYIEMERNFFQNFVAGEFNQYIKRKKIDGVWGDDVQIEAISQIYNRPIQIFVNGTKPIRTFHEQTGNNIGPIKLAYLGRCHYNSIKDVNELNEGLMKTKFGQYENNFLQSYNLLKQQQKQIYKQVYRDQFTSFTPMEEIINQILIAQIEMKQIQDINKKTLKEEETNVMIIQIEQAELKEAKQKQQQQKIQQQLEIIEKIQIQQTKKKSAIQTNEQWIQNIRQQGFSDDQILMAIEARGNDPNAVLNYLYDHF